MIGISYDPKIDAFLRYVGEGGALDIRALSEGQLEAAADAVIADAGLIRERLNKNTAELRRLALEDCSAVKTLLDGSDTALQKG